MAPATDIGKHVLCGGKKSAPITVFQYHVRPGARFASCFGHELRRSLHIRVPISNLR
jgi:hypothetical protein